jgi:hypothetical protein
MKYILTKNQFNMSYLPTIKFSTVPETQRQKDQGYGSAFSMCKNSGISSSKSKGARNSKAKGSGMGFAEIRKIG